MKVKSEDSIKKKVLDEIIKMPGNVIVRKELTSLGSPRQISRALKALVAENVLSKLGYGVYAKLEKSKFTGDTYLKGGFLIVGREALTKLGLVWDLSNAEKAYNTGKTQQVPINPPTKLKRRCRMILSYEDMEMKFE